MGFKSVSQYNDERYANFLMLRNDGEYADVVFLYRNYNEVLVADAHYLKFGDFSGYVQCLGKGCPACNYGERGIRVESKLFIPVYNVDTHEIQFWDRNLAYEPYFQNAVFNTTANPSEYVYRITRRGAFRDRNTRYEITIQGKNPRTYDEIMAECGTKFPDFFNDVCKEWSLNDYNEHMQQANTSAGAVDLDSMPEYKLSPRTAPAQMPDLPTYPEADKFEASEAAEIAAAPRTDVVELADDVDF